MYIHKGFSVENLGPYRRPQIGNTKKKEKSMKIQAIIELLQSWV